MEPDRETGNHYYRSLTRRMVLIVALVSLTPLFLVSGIILYQFHASYEEKVYDHLSELVRKHTQNIDGFLNEKLADIRFLAETFVFEDLSKESFLRDILETLQRDYGPVFVDLGVVNTQGLQVSYAGPFKLEKVIYYDADWFKKAMKKRYFISDVFLGIRGLPKGVVDGSMPSDLFIVSRDEPMKILRKVIARKEQKFVCYPQEGVRRMDTSRDEAIAASLSDGKAMELARIALRLEEYYGTPQDIE